MADVLEQFFAGGKTEAPPAKPSTPSVSQSKRDLDAMAILQDELSKAQKRASSGDPRAARDVESLLREIAGRNKTIKKSVSSEAQAAAPVSSDPLEAFFSGKQAQAPQAAPVATTAPTAPVAQPSAPSVQAPPPDQQKQGGVRGVVSRLFGQVPSAGEVFGQFQEGKRALG